MQRIAMAKRGEEKKRRAWEKRGEDENGNGKEEPRSAQDWRLKAWPRNGLENRRKGKAGHRLAKTAMEVLRFAERRKGKEEHWNVKQRNGADKHGSELRNVRRGSEIQPGKRLVLPVRDRDREGAYGMQISHGGTG